MAGTIFSAVFEMDFNPPKVIIATRMVITAAEGRIGTPMDACKEDVMALTCVVVPDPSIAVSVPKKANASARGFHFFPSPCSM